MPYNTLSAALVPVELWQEIGAWSLYHAFEQITDGRSPRGKRYSLACAARQGQPAHVGGGFAPLFR